ncbi:MAG: hypothetical protein M1449_00010 [Candidatus Thermoplasmatota archaeon]|nr:hypothetical protein [Candidatus Thermoplasmatota archaeon]
MNMRRGSLPPWRTILLGCAALALTVGGIALAAKVPDVRNTRHNLSVSGPGSVKAVGESQVCVFCHTPHAAENIPAAPLWNRALSGATYTPYASASMEANATELANAPGGSSKLCLSCHDGTLAIGNVNVLSGQSPATITMSGAAAGGGMPPGAGELTGFTRNLGVNLTNDHPISFTYDSTLAGADGELRVPDGVNVGNRVAGVSPKPKLPLENNQTQCATCHDPHLRETDPAKGNAKFLRANRFQEVAPTGGAFSATNDIVCLACHDKAGPTWAGSAHANPSVADETYLDAAANLREFPLGAKVWQAACLNCHDTHTVQGARRLLREGTDSAGIPKSGGNPAIEQTCYQCHSSAAESILTSVANVPNIKSDFSLPRRMPIDLQPEAHNIGTAPLPQAGKDFAESQQAMGKTVPSNRHAECTDCHNPHRVLFRSFAYANPGIPDAAGTHDHAAGHTNIASGVLRGISGVEPVYGSAAFMSNPSSYTVKRGEGGTGAATTVSSAYVTREYQICLKCHSDFAYDTPPNLGDSPGGTPSGTNLLTKYTNQAMEFQAPLAHKGEVSTTDSGAKLTTNNHRSWHPVMDNTGRTPAVRGNTNPNNWLAPWNGAADVGNQTMYCSDCHGSATASNTVAPSGGEDGNPWGPHGSSNDFILKGQWNQSVGTATADALCFRCHQYDQYANPNPPTVQISGFCCGGMGGGMGGGIGGGSNLHVYHAGRVQAFGGVFRCSKCHVAVPHGWKNKAFLANLKDVGPEAGLPAGTAKSAPYSQEPYYLGAWLKVDSFAKSGDWSYGNCSSTGMSSCGNAP